MQSLSLGGNDIKSFMEIEELGASLKNIIQLDLSNNPISNLKNYNDKCWELFPNLLILDNYDKLGIAFEYSSVQKYFIYYYFTIVVQYLYLM